MVAILNNARATSPTLRLVTACDCYNGIRHDISGQAYPCPYCNAGQRVGEWDEQAVIAVLFMVGLWDAVQEEVEYRRWEAQADAEAALYDDWCTDRYYSTPMDIA
jgi:hypothetical protein